MTMNWEDVRRGMETLRRQDDHTEDQRTVVSPRLYEDIVKLVGEEEAAKRYVRWSYLPTTPMR